MGDEVGEGGTGSMLAFGSVRLRLSPLTVTKNGRFFNNIILFKDLYLSVSHSLTDTRGGVGCFAPHIALH